MFIPLKIFLLLSDSASTKSFSPISDVFGQSGVTAFLLSLTAILYLFNIAVQTYQARLLNRQREKIDKCEYFSGGRVYSSSFVKRSYKIYFKFSADVIMIAVSMLMFGALSLEYLYIFVLILFLFLLGTNYLVMTPNKFGFLNSLKIDQSQAMNISGSLLYLSLFFSVFYVFMVYNISVTYAILLLLMSRLSNASVRGFLVGANQVFELRNKHSRVSC
ncbi:hypothetical protein [Enterovibrio norvegicus]|uniref:hypothetical protein n=1 Tax=Enterovibrio norvegicus TaxID=188144 RepID=UPI001112DE61|nr:hypothetical protein [Enterovibrio norvegicus]